MIGQLNVLTRVISDYDAVAELQTAVDSRDAQAIRAAICYVENVNFSLLLAEEVEAAKQLLRSLERIEALKEAVLKLDQKTMLELRNYSKPPKIVHQVIKATLLLLGYDESLIVVSGMTDFKHHVLYTVEGQN